MSEAEFKRKLMKELRSLPRTWAERIEQQAISGTPDIMGHMGGLFFSLEAKANGKRPTPLQALKLEEIRATGGFASVIQPRNKEEILHALIEYVRSRGGLL